MQTISFKISSGEDLMNSLLNISKQEKKDFFVLSVVGNLSRSSFQCPGQKDPIVLEEELEILSLNGTISIHKCHLHVCVSNSKCQAFGGHIVEGSIVAKNVDILLGYLDSDDSINQNHDYSIPIKSKLIEVYVLKNCPWSKRATRFLTSSGVEHVVHEVDSELAYKSLYQISKYDKFPQIFIDGQFIGGYDNLIQFAAEGNLV